MIEITGTRYEYSPAEYDISKCNPTIDLDFVKMLKTNGNCVNIYPSSNCTGWFIRFAYRDSYIRFPKTYRWVGDEVMPRGLEIGSVGPCFDKCDVRNWYGDRKQEPAHVTLYGERDFRGDTINVDGSKWFVIINAQQKDARTIRTSKWCAILTIDKENITPNTRVCGKHFASSQFKQTRLIRDARPRVPITQPPASTLPIMPASLPTTAKSNKIIIKKLKDKNRYLRTRRRKSNILSEIEKVFQGHPSMLELVKMQYQRFILKRRKHYSMEETIIAITFYYSTTQKGYKSLHAEGYGYVLTRRFQEDILEHFFGFQRGIHGLCTNPTTKQFREGFKCGLILDLMQNKEGRNCQMSFADDSSDSEFEENEIDDNDQFLTTNQRNDVFRIGEINDFDCADETVACYVGNSTSISIDGDGCFLIPLGFGTWIHSMKITGDENSCIELHDVASCGGKFTQFRPDYPELQNLFGWVLEDKDTFASLVKAISRCGQFCNKSVPDINPKSVAPIWGKNIVTLYKYQGHYGHSVNLNLTNGCVSLANERQYAVVQTYGQCVVLYGLANCEEKQGFYTLQTRKLIYLTIPVYPKSMKLCGDDDEQVELVDEEKFGLENTSSHVSIPIWAVILFCVGALFVLVFTAVRGACVYKSYANIDNKRQVERLSVAYKSDA
ncbi:Transposable element P transposase [Folsomia candida]|uniref:Transposable element P transposase n=1 Tax=Folsomia candida TaxID=158441 RepID=A0A226CZV1_FOLCA|nr:Transposable element P transposase [Folsomia candida]